METDLQKILSIAGHQGLFKYLSQARQGIIVESIKDGKRTCIPSANKVSSLSDITIFTNNDDDLLLRDIFLRIKEKSNDEQILSHKSPTDELMSYFEEIIPEYDKDKVFPSHVKKMIEWYNILQENNLLNFLAEEKAEESEEEKE